MNNQIRMARRNAGITQEQLSKSLGINRATLSRYESGEINPPASQLQRIADVLGVSADYLLGVKHLKGILDYKVAATRDRILDAVKQTGLSNEEFCQKLGLPIDEWFKWKEASSTSYLEHLPEISMLLDIPEDVLSGKDTVCPNSTRLIAAFNQLNPSGQTEAVKRVSELTEIPRYQRSDAQDAAKGTEDTSLPAETPINGSGSPTEGKK